MAAQAGGQDGPLDSPWEGNGDMSLSERSLETLIDLIENKLSCLEVYDRDDARELANLEQCLKELRALAGLDDDTQTIVAFKQRRRGRRRAAV